MSRMREGSKHASANMPKAIIIKRLSINLMVSIGEGFCVCFRWVLSGVTCMFVSVFMRV